MECLRFIIDFKCERSDKQSIKSIKQSIKSYIVYKTVYKGERSEPRVFYMIIWLIKIMKCQKCRINVENVAANDKNSHKLNKIININLVARFARP